MQRLGDDLFTHSRTVGVCGVYEVDSQFDSAPQNADGLGAICRLAPNSISRDSHRAESQSCYPEIAPNQKLASFFGKCLALPLLSLVILHIVLHFRRR